MPNNAKHYTYKTFWFEPDQNYVGVCVEMPGLSHFDEDAVAALRGIRDLVEFAVDEMIAAGEPPPEAIADANYSGQFITRVPKILHYQLAIEAKENGVSLNSLVNHKLSAPILTKLRGRNGVSGRPIKRKAGTSVNP